MKSLLVSTFSFLAGPRLEGKNRQYSFGLHGYTEKEEVRQKKGLYGKHFCSLREGKLLNFVKIFKGRKNDKRQERDGD